jgi:mannose-1-phosphate guanylyltransferase
LCYDNFYTNGGWKIFKLFELFKIWKEVKRKAIETSKNMFEKSQTQESMINLKQTKYFKS